MQNRVLCRVHPGSIITTLLVAGLLIQTTQAAFAQQAPEREAYFGETHVHTSWSLDSYLGFATPSRGRKSSISIPWGNPSRDG